MTLPGGSRLGGLSGHAAWADVVTSVPSRLRLIITDTGAMLRACAEIDRAAETARRYLEDLNQQYYSVTPMVWSANDQEAFAERLRKYRDSVVNTCCLAEESAMLTAVIATLRFVQHAVTAVLAGTLAVLAAAFWVAMAVPGGQPVATSIRSSGTPLANTLPRIVRIMDEVMVRCGQVHASLLAIRTLEAGISDEIRLEDGGGMSDVLRSAGLTLGDVVEKFLSKLKVWEKI
ncbi:hypothetical protein [Thermasporomyces composti]|uniref:Uncharacterized protein n=1 Tax=Thermasporomyces composti TaxID=696763 RepID=A0A3D9VGL1_THECX|nr:hypothetical protein [Thermasporomyces composti]REF38285.1 hypothetical protein DFJ64_3760 [Thermasporomyces composti]